MLLFVNSNAALGITTVIRSQLLNCIICGVLKRIRKMIFMYNNPSS